MTDTGASRGAFSSRLGFILAAAGSAIGLGNIWRFPYITGENGGGAFVLLYLFCIAIVGLPIMIGEIMLGRMTQKSPVGAFKALAGDRSPWKALGAMGVLAGFFMLSFYSVVAGWSLHFTWLSIQGGFGGMAVEDAGAIFGSLAADGGMNLFWHVVFMVLTTLVVIGGVQKGIERWANILMPALLLMMLYLLYKASQMSGFDEALGFVFGTHTEDLSAAGVLEALGHSFFTLSLGMGAMITYGSYMRRETSIFANSVAICVLDTLIALLACMILFPITFTHGMEPDQGAGFVFQNIPVALSQMAGSAVIGVVFFGLLMFAALTSAISLLEVVASYFIDERGWTRKRATLLCAAAITLFGVPSALSGSVPLFGEERLDWFNNLANLVSNVMLPLGGLGVALFCSWRLDELRRRDEFVRHSRMAAAYGGWLFLMRFIVPVIVVIVFLNSVGVIELQGH